MKIHQIHVFHVYRNMAASFKKKKNIYGNVKVAAAKNKFLSTLSRHEHCYKLPLERLLTLTVKVTLFCK